MALSDQHFRNYIRIRLGEIPESKLSDDVMNMYIDVAKAQYTSEKDRAYYSIISIVNHIITKHTAAGDPSRVMEMEGQVMLDVQGLEFIQGWENWLDKFKKNPGLGGLEGDLAAASASNVGKLVLIGGTSKTEVERVQKHSDRIYQGACIGGFYTDD